jgi:glycosyltransferase involved in cell wall biosynthesis
VGGIPEAMSENKNGLIVDYDNSLELSKAIFSILEDSNISKEMGDFGREFSSKFSWTNIIDLIEKEYELLLA